MGSAESISNVKEIKKEDLEYLKTQISDTTSIDEDVAKITNKMNESQDKKKYQDILDEINDLKEQRSQLIMLIDEGIEKCEDGKLTREKNDELVNKILTETNNYTEKSVEVASMIFNVDKPMSAEDLIEKIEAPHGKEESKYVTGAVNNFVIPLKGVLTDEDYNKLIVDMSAVLDEHDVVDDRRLILQKWAGITDPYHVKAEVIINNKLSKFNLDDKCVFFNLGTSHYHGALFKDVSKIPKLMEIFNSDGLKELAYEYEKAFGHKLCFMTVADLADLKTRTTEYMALRDAYLKSVHELETLNRCGTNSTDEEVVKILNEEWDKVGYKSDYDKIESITKKKEELVKKINIINEILTIGKYIPYFDKVGCIDSNDMYKLKDMKNKLSTIKSHIDLYNDEEKAKKIVMNPSSQFTTDASKDIDILYKVYVEEIPEQVSREKKERRKKMITIGIVIGVVVLIIVLALLFVFKHNKPLQMQEQMQPIEVM